MTFELLYIFAPALLPIYLTIGETAPAVECNNFRVPFCIIYSLLLSNHSSKFKISDELLSFKNG